MSEQACLEIVLAGWVDALRRRDLDTLAGHLHPAVVWNGMRPGLACGDREAVLENLRHAEIPPIDGIELRAVANKVLFGARSPDFDERFGVQLDGAVYDVFTIREGLIVSIEEFGQRDAALAELHWPDPHLTDEAAPEQPVRPPAGAVDGLIPFVHVADVQRSIDFYALLGFDVEDTHHHGDQLDFAALRNGDGRLMLARASAPIHPGEQAVLFYLYSPDLDGLREHLIAHRARPGQILDGTPGPKRELRIYDPDGYCLMVAERDHPPRAIQRTTS